MFITCSVPAKVRYNSNDIYTEIAIAVKVVFKYSKQAMRYIVKPLIAPPTDRILS